MGSVISLAQRREEAHVEHVAFAQTVEDRSALIARRYAEDFAAGKPSLTTIALLKDLREQAKRTADEHVALFGGDAA